MLELDTRQIYHFTPVSALLSAQFHRRCTPITAPLTEKKVLVDGTVIGVPSVSEKSVELGTVSENLAVSGLMGRWKPAHKIRIETKNVKSQIIEKNRHLDG